MNVEALDHDAALAGIEGRAGEQLGRYFLWIDIVEHNGGVVAAELQREALRENTNAPSLLGSRFFIRIKTS
jgi:hypothetical protein